MFTLYNVRYWMFTSLFTLYHRPLDKYAQLKKKCSYFSTKRYVVGTLKNVSMRQFC